uniref:Thrombospondin type 1 domain protein n=1 Tax=Acrobeloides nanus TaxID=290746 RepID=A0A914ED27_9BILA
MPNCCPAQGVWSQWSEPSGCNDTCGACGVGTRQRYCMTEGNGCPCTGDNTQNVPCNLMPCKYPKNSCCIGKVQNFNGTIKCTVTTSTETPASLFCTTVNQLTASVCCPSGGTWSEWSTSQTCSDTCGSCAQLTYTRTCTSGPTCPCSGNPSKTVNCNLTPCLYPKNSCCGSYRTMFASGQAICGPQPVEPDDTPSDSIVCTTVPGSAAICAPGGEWSSWTQGTCSDNCGMCGTQINTRTCLSQSRGCPCSGSSTESFACAPADCKYPRPTCCSGYTSSVVNGSFICVLKNG